MRFILCLTIFLSFSASAQVRTGGGGVVSPEDSIGSSSSLINFENQLIVSHLQCKSKGQERLQLGKDLSSIYSQLLVIKNLDLMKGECEKRNAYFKCLNSPEYKKSLASLEKDPTSAKVLKSKYNMNSKEVRQFFKFFKTIDKGCDDTCN